MIHLLSLEDVWFSYPNGIDVLREASLKVDRGEIVAIIGANGSGKTTLLLLMAGLLRPDRGRIVLDGSDLRDLLPGARRRIGILFQVPDDQLFNPTVYDEVSFALRQLFREDEVARRVEAVAEELGIIDLLDRPPYRLSLGEKRRVALASILAYDPDLLLLDEPTAHLGQGFAEVIKGILDGAKERGKGVAIASHDIEFVAEVADRVYVLSGGGLIGGGDAKDVLSDDRLLSLAEMKPPLILRAMRMLGMPDPPMTIDGLARLLSGCQRMSKGSKVADS